MIPPYDYIADLAGSRRYTLHLYNASIYFDSSSREIQGQQDPSSSSIANLTAEPQYKFGLDMSHSLQMSQ